MKLRETLAACGAVTVICSLSPAHAADVSWVGDTSSDWNTGANWSTDLLPTGADNVLVNTSSGNIATLSASSAFTPVDIKVGTTGNTGRLDHTAGTLATGNNNWTFVGQGTGTGTYNLANTSSAGGTFTGHGLGSGSLDVGGPSTNGGRLTVGDGGTSNGTFNMNTSGTLEAWHTTVSLLIGTNGGDGTFNLDAGTVNTRDVWFGDNNVNSTGTLNMSGGIINAEDLLLGRANAQGVVNMTGGTVNATWVALARSTSAANTGSGTFTLGSAATLNSTGYVEIGLGGNGATGAAQGTMTVSGALNVNTGNVGGKLGISTYDSVKGTLNLESGSVVKLHHNAQLAFANVNNSGTGVVNHNGGTVTFYSDGGTTAGGTGFLNMNQGGSGSYTYHLNGGTLNVPRIGSVATGGSRTFNFNGGTLRATGASAAFLDLGTGTTRVNVRDGGAIIDSNGFDITVAGALLHSDVSGDAATDGGLTKNGAGTLTLSANSTYSGATIINNGTLAVNGTLNGTSGTSIATGATLIGTGSITTGTVSFTGAGFVNAGNSVGTLGVAAADLSGGTLKVEYDTGTISLVDLFSVAGMLDIGGASVDFDDIGGDLDGTSSYVFASYGSLLGISFANVFDLPTGYTIDYGTGTNSTLSLVPVPEPACALLGGLGSLLLLRRRRMV